MPTYDYKCVKCEHSFQVVERMAEHERIRHKCPKCKSTKVERVLAHVMVKTARKS